MVDDADESDNACDPHQARIAEAEEALHQLILGKSVVEIRYGGFGKMMRFTPADVGRLRAYLSELRGGRISTVRFSTSKGLC